MKLERQIEELAKIQYPNGYTGYGRDYPDYDTYDPLHRIINGMGKDELKRFQDELCKLLSRDKGDVYVCFYECWKATELQMMEAIIKAKGKWEKE